MTSIISTANIANLRPASRLLRNCEMARKARGYELMGKANVEYIDGLLSSMAETAYSPRTPSSNLSLQELPKPDAPPSTSLVETFL